MPHHGPIGRILLKRGLRLSEVPKINGKQDYTYDTGRIAENTADKMSEKSFEPLYWTKKNTVKF